MESRATELSVVVPAYDEETRLGGSLRRIVDYLGRRGSVCEVLVVDDGSRDATAEVAGSFRGRGVRTLRLGRNHGKGTAVREGVLASRGDWILITDADLSTPIEELETLEASRQRADLILGSRAAAGSRIGRRQARYRELMGKSFNLLIRLLGLAEIRDTQCGFKLLRGPVARSLFAVMEVRRFAYDVELVWLARRLGYSVVEVGVEWNDSPGSRVHPVWDSARMLADVLRLRFRN